MISPDLNTLLSSLPYQRVTSSESGGDNFEEIFDIYCLGLFKGPDPALVLPESSNLEDPTPEIVELVLLKPQTSYKPHYHKKSVAVIYIVHGTGLFLCGDHQKSYEKGQRFSIPARVKHGFKTTTDTLFLSIQTPPILDRKTGHLDLYYDKNEHSIGESQ
jgi:quercetin dioxygenase-like cupin family protein